MRAGNERASGNNIVIPVAANTTITEGHMVAIGSDGYATEASKAESLTIAGCAMSEEARLYGIMMEASRQPIS